MLYFCERTGITAVEYCILVNGKGVPHGLLVTDSKGGAHLCYKTEEPGLSEDCLLPSQQSGIFLLFIYFHFYTFTRLVGVGQVKGTHSIVWHSGLEPST